MWVDLTNDVFQNLGHNLGGITLEEPIALVESRCRDMAWVHVDDGDFCALCTGFVDVAGGRIDFGTGANDHDEINGLVGAHVLVNVVEDVCGESFAEPDDAGTQEAALAGWAFGEMAVVQLGEGHFFVGNVEFAGGEGRRGGGVCVVGGDGEGGDNGVRVVVFFHVGAEEVGAFDVEEGAVQEFELRGGVLGAGGEAWDGQVSTYIYIYSYIKIGKEACSLTIDILAQCYEAWLPPRQFSQGVVGGVGSCFEGHVASVAVKLPDQAGVSLKGLWRRQFRCIVCPPQSACAPKCG